MSNVYDQASRYVLKQCSRPLLAWLFGLRPDEIDFVDWVDTRTIPWPGADKERTCDTVAHLRDVEDGGRPWAVAVEFQAEPDELMFGRGLEYLGRLWRERKPTELPGDRFEVGLVVVNLTGAGLASRSMRLANTRLATALDVVERNLGKIPVNEVMRDIEAGDAPRVLLAWVPLFHGGDDLGIIPEWKRLAEQEKDKEKRKTLGLARVYAKLVGCGVDWTQALKEWDMIEEPEFIVEKRMQAVRAAKAEAVLDVLRLRFGDLPGELSQAINSCPDLGKLRDWTLQAVKVRSLAKFRKDACL